MTAKLPTQFLLALGPGRAHPQTAALSSCGGFARVGEAWFWSWEHMAMLVGSGLHTTLTSSCRNMMEMNDCSQSGGLLSPSPPHEHVSLSLVGLADSIC
jgi:hypothetical protein